LEKRGILMLKTKHEAFRGRRAKGKDGGRGRFIILSWRRMKGGEGRMKGKSFAYSECVSFLERGEGGRKRGEKKRGRTLSSIFLLYPWGGEGGSELLWRGGRSNRSRLEQTDCKGASIRKKRRGRKGVLPIFISFSGGKRRGA